MGLTKEKLTDMYRQMLTIRRFEQKASELYKSGKIPGDVHLCIGQEAVAVGICSNLTRQDLIAVTHRAHGQVYAKGADFNKMMAELFGNAPAAAKARGAPSTWPTSRRGSSAPTGSSAAAWASARGRRSPAC